MCIRDSPNDASLTDRRDASGRKKDTSVSGRRDASGRKNDTSVSGRRDAAGRAHDASVAGSDTSIGLARDSLPRDMLTCDKLPRGTTTGVLVLGSAGSTGTGELDASRNVRSAREMSTVEFHNDSSARGASDGRASKLSAAICGAARCHASEPASLGASVSSSDPSIHSSTRFDSAKNASRSSWPCSSSRTDPIRRPVREPRPAS